MEASHRERNQRANVIKENKINVLKENVIKGNKSFNLLGFVRGGEGKLR